MITAQDIREKTFEKSKFSGYDMAEVDEFLEQIADDLTAAQKENAVLKSKLKVLAQKIEEYRDNESALNKAVLSAHQLADQITSDAQATADKMIADANAEVRAKLGNIDELREAEEKKLHDAQAASAKFFEGIRAMCNAQLKNIDNISSQVLPKKAEPVKAEPVEEEPVKVVPETKKEVDDATAAVEAAVRSIEQSVAKIQPAPTAKLDLSADMDAAFAKPDLDSTQPFSL